MDLLLEIIPWGRRSRMAPELSGVHNIEPWSLCYNPAGTARPNMSLSAAGQFGTDWSEQLEWAGGPVEQSRSNVPVPLTACELLGTSFQL